MASEYMRQLIREKLQEARFHEKILDGMNSPISEMNRDEFYSSLLEIARDEQYLDHPRAQKGPTEAINGQLEHLRRSG